MQVRLVAAFQGTGQPSGRLSQHDPDCRYDAGSSHGSQQIDLGGNKGSNSRIEVS